MKRILITVTSGLFCLLISCKCPNSMESETNQKNLDINSKVMKALETGDAATINSLVADDIVDHMGPNGKEIKGGETIKPMLINMHKHIKDFKIEVITASANDDYVFTLSKTMGTTIDTTMGIPTGTVMNENMVDLVKIKDGKIVEHWGYVDPAAMMKHMDEMHKGKMHMTEPKIEPTNKK